MQEKNTITKSNWFFLFYLFFYMTVCLCMSSEENTALDLDDHGGRTFLRVLLHLTMHDYPPLVSRALHLLFRHFSQRQEVLQAFKQVSQLQTSKLKQAVIIQYTVCALFLFAE